MVKKRLLLALEVCSIVLVSLSISSFAILPSSLDRGLTVPVQFSTTNHLDCFRRQYNFSHQDASSVQQDASNHYMILG
jgi:hypothetical protein